MKQYLIPFLVGVALVACMLVTYQIGRGIGYDKGVAEALNQPHKADTIWKTDTHFVDRPVEVWRTKEKLVYVKVDSLITVHDTTYVALEREQKGYKGEDYEAQVSGVEPALDWIKVFPKTAYVQNTITMRKRWSFSITGGPGVFWDGREIKPGAGIVAGFGYNF